MKNKKLSSSLIVLLLALTSCANTIKFTGESRAGNLLKSDTSRNVAMQTKIHTKCDRIDNIHTEITRTNPIGTGKTPGSIKYGSVDERWTVSGCGQSIPFLVTFTPDGEGGTYFNVSREK